MALRRYKTVSVLSASWRWVRRFRSDAALEAIAKASEEKVPNLVLYNYPSFSGAYSALFAHLFHSQISAPCLILPFSRVEPFRVEDLCFGSLERCYLLDFLAPADFAWKLSKQSTCKVIGFDHRKSAFSQVLFSNDCGENLTFHINVEKGSSNAAYEYFSTELAKINCFQGEVVDLVDTEERSRLELILKYIEDGDLLRWSLPDIKAFNVGLREWRSKLNCITNPYMYEQLLELNAEEVISKGNSYFLSRQNSAHKLIDKVFRLQLGRGLYGECLGVRADGNTELVDEIGKILSVKSASAGLRPIGAVVFMQRKNLKMCLRSTDRSTDTSEVAKAYGGGGSQSSSSFIIRMDEYNQWTSVNHSTKSVLLSRFKAKTKSNILVKNVVCSSRDNVMP